MKTIEAIAILDSRFEEFNLSILDYCANHNIAISYDKYDYDISFEKYLEMLFAKIYNKMITSNVDHIMVFGPYLNVNFKNIKPELFISEDLDLSFFKPIIENESWSFFVVNNTSKVLNSIRKIIGIDQKINPIAICSSKYKSSIKDYINSIKNTFIECNLKIKEESRENVIFTFLNKNNIFNSFCTSFNDSELSFESRIANVKKEKFDIKISNSKHYFNDICITSLYTDNIVNYAKYSLDSIYTYCNKNLISYKVYDKPILENAAPNWSKPFIISSILDHYDTVVWIDSDCFITNKNFDIRSFSNSIPKDFIVFKDPSSLFDFNSGVMIFKKSKFTIELLNEVKSDVLSRMDKTGIYTSGGDQLSFVKKRKELDRYGYNSIIMPSEIMNSHPLEHKDSHFLVHAMGYGHEYRENYLSYLHKKNI